MNIFTKSSIRAHEILVSTERIGHGEQDENGVDLSLIREMLKLTPLQRIRRGDEARIQTLRLMEYGRGHEEQSR